MKRFGTGIFLLGASMAFIGCGNDEEATAPPATQPVEIASPGSAPTFGEQSGMGFPTGDAAHSDGAGSGLMGFHGEGKMGTSSAISDQHPISKPAFAATEPVLPAP